MSGLQSVAPHDLATKPSIAYVVRTTAIFYAPLLIFFGGGAFTTQMIGSGGRSGI